jgi:CBS domain-containing protein
MQRISELMTRDVHTLAPADSVVQAARTMQTFDVGAIPVCGNGKLVGMVTDRDLVLRAVAQDRRPTRRRRRPS